MAIQKFARYAACYRVASSYRGVRFSGLGVRTSSGYSAGLGVFLAYSALESCCEAVGRKVSTICVFDPLLAAELRSTAHASLASMRDERNDRQLRMKFTDFVEGKTDDVMLVVRVIRHLVAHAAFTAWGHHATSLKVAKLYDKLSEIVLLHSDSVLQQRLLRLTRDSRGI